MGGSPAAGKGSIVLSQSIWIKARAARRLIVAISLLGSSTLTVQTAVAQYGPPPWAYPYYRCDYPPPPGPPGDEGPITAPHYEQHGLTIADIRRRVSRLGLRLVAKPRRKDDIYLAEAAEPNGTGHRLVFDAEGGKLIENTTLLPRKKKVGSPPPASPTNPGQ